MIKLLLIMVNLVLLTSCLKTIDETRDWTADKFYQDAHDKLISGDYPTAIKNYEKLQSHFPYSPHARQAEIEVIYAYYKYDEHDSAILNANRFISENPDHSHLDYIYYLRALTQYNKGTDFLGKLLPQDIAERGAESKIKALNYFNELIQVFPESRYYRDSILRMTYLNNKLAEHDINVAKFYQRKEAYIASINRSKKVIKKYPEAPATSNALIILRDSYAKLGYPGISKKYQKIITLNQPKLNMNKPETSTNLETIPE